MIHPVILSGGHGKRLWPLSTEEKPKQFHTFGGDRSLFQRAVLRTHGGAFGRPTVIASYGHRDAIAYELGAIGVAPRTVVLEPVGRDTAAACCIAALTFRRDGLNEPIATIPSDHLIEDRDALHAALAAAAGAAKDGALALLGIPPTIPSPDYGYIQVAGNATGGTALRIERFIEKPAASLAQELIGAGATYWNSGIYVFLPDNFLAEMAALCPEILERCEDALNRAVYDGHCCILDEKAFSSVPKVPVDRAITEKTARAMVVPAAIGWNDVGTWMGLWSFLTKDEQQNAGSGPVVLRDSQRTFAYSDGPFVAVVGQEDIAVVAHGGHVLICPMAQTSALGDLASLHARDTPAPGTTDHRPWGRYTVLARGDGFLVKEVVVEPGERISLQRHQHRREVWTIMEGLARITRADEVLTLAAQQSIDIPPLCLHRIENIGDVPLRFVEIQAGRILTEADIERFEDKYGRVG